MAEKKIASSETIKTRQSRKSGLKGKEPATRFNWPLGARNLYVLTAALVVIVIGYIFLGQGPAESVSSRTIAPVILVFGYMILVPLAVIIRDPSKDKKQ